MFFKRKAYEKDKIPILLVSDPQMLAEIKKLRPNKYKITGVSNTASAIEIMQNQKFLSVVIDCRAIKEEEDFELHITNLLASAKARNIVIIMKSCRNVISSQLLSMEDTYFVEDTTNAVETLDILSENAHITDTKHVVFRKEVGFYSVKGGVGTTTSAITASMFIASAGFPTLLVDASPTRGNVVNYLIWSGITKINEEDFPKISEILSTIRSIKDEEERKKSIAEYLMISPKIRNNLQVIRGISDPIELDPNNITREEALSFLDTASRMYDFVMLDLGNNANNVFMKVLNERGEYIVFTAAPRMASVDDTISSILSIKPPHSFVLVNTNSSNDELDSHEALKIILSDTKVIDNVVPLPIVPLDKGLNFAIYRDNFKARLSSATIKTYRRIAKIIIETK